MLNSTIIKKRKIDVTSHVKKKYGPSKKKKKEKERKNSEANATIQTEEKGDPTQPKPKRPNHASKHVRQTWKDHSMLRDVDIDYLVKCENNMKNIELGDWVKFLDNKPERRINEHEEDEKNVINGVITNSKALHFNERSKQQNHPRTIDLVMKVKIDPYPVCTVGNVVSTFKIPGAVQNQRKLCLYGKKVTPCYFDPKIFAHSQTSIRINEFPKVKVLGFPSETALMAGGKSDEHNRLMAWKYVNFLQEVYGIKSASVVGFMNKNMVANVRVPFWVNLKKLEQHIGSDRASFLPIDIKCCKVISAKNSSVTLMFFTAGSILITGFNGDEQFVESYLEGCELAYGHKLSDKKKKEYMDKYQKKRKSSSVQYVEEVNRVIQRVNEEEKARQRKLKRQRKELQKELLGITGEGRVYMSLLGEGEEERHNTIKDYLQNGGSLEGIDIIPVNVPTYKGQ